MVSVTTQQLYCILHAFLLLHNILIEIYDVIDLIMSTVWNSKLHIFLTPTLLIMFAECSVQ